MSVPVNTEQNNASKLVLLRQEIDRIDEAMHRLLIERSEIISALISVKGTQLSGQAFRPGREAYMMHRLAERHQGILPLDTAENIWRIIISTFTYVQAPFNVHADVSSSDGSMRDSARFHFGFTVPYVSHAGAEAVIAAVIQSKGDLGILRPDQSMGSYPWWELLRAHEAPKIIARLPFIERPDHPAGIPLFVVSHPLGNAAARDLVLIAIRIKKWQEEIKESLADIGAEIIGITRFGNELSFLVSVIESGGVESVRSILAKTCTDIIEIGEVGSLACRYSKGSGAN